MKKVSFQIWRNSSRGDSLLKFDAGTVFNTFGVIMVYNIYICYIYCVVSAA